MDIYFGKGIDDVGSLFSLAVDLDLIKKGGAGVYEWDGVRKRGEEAFKEFLRSSPSEVEKLKNVILAERETAAEKTDTVGDEEELPEEEKTDDK